MIRGRNDFGRNQRLMTIITLWTRKMAKTVGKRWKKVSKVDVEKAKEDGEMEMYMITHCNNSSTLNWLLTLM